MGGGRNTDEAEKGDREGEVERKGENRRRGEGMRSKGEQERIDG